MISPETERKPGVADASPLEKADIAVVEQVASSRRHPAVRAAAKLSELGDQPPLFALGGAVLALGLVRRSRREVEAGLRVLAAEALATGIKHLVKRAVRRSRPHVLLDEGEYRAEVGEAPRKQEQSFPSGHTAGAVAVAGALAPVYPKAAAPLWVAAAAIALIQAPRGAHYPTDIAAGAAIGAFSAWAVDRAARLFR